MKINSTLSNVIRALPDSADDVTLPLQKKETPLHFNNLPTGERMRKIEFFFKEATEHEQLLVKTRLQRPTFELRIFIVLPSIRGLLFVFLAMREVKPKLGFTKLNTVKIINKNKVEAQV